MNQNFIDGLVGWSAGYAYTNEKSREDEVKQGKNYYLGAISLSSQMSHFAVLISKINETLTLPLYGYSAAVRILCNVGPILSLPAFLFLASVKQGEYENIAHWFNGTPYAYVKLPEKLSGRTVTFLSFFAEHSGNMIRVAVVAASVSLIALGSTVYGAAVLTALTYEAVDTLGFVPRRISLFMEIYMPTVSLIGMTLGGTALVRVISVIMLSTNTFPFIAKLLHQRVDACVRYIFGMEGASLKEIDAPLEEKKKMTYDEINKILDSSLYDFELNPAHCSHPLIDLEHLPKDNDFDRFLPLFDAIDWEGNYQVVQRKLKDDDGFIVFLLENFPGKKKDDIQGDVERYIEELASKKGVSKERFAADWIREQIVSFIDALQGKKRIKGLQQDLDEAIKDSAILLPYITSLQNPVDQEDNLLKLAVEGGDYCGRGVKRTTNELIRGILQAEVQQDNAGDPLRDYELRILQSLQNVRHAKIQMIYKQLAKQLNIPDAISQDTHGFDIYRLNFSLGFFPLTEHERRRVGLVEILLWELYNNARVDMYEGYLYAMDDAVREVGEAYFWVYLEQIINENDLLTDVQKAEILEKYVERNDDQWTVEETYEKFHNLMFVRLGALRFKS